MAKIRTTKQRIEDELNRNMAQAMAGRVPALRTALQNYTPVPVAAVKTQSIEKTEPTYSHGGGGARRTQEAIKQREDRFVEEYNSMPNYDIADRAVDLVGRGLKSVIPGLESGGRGTDSKSQRYAEKSELTERYNEIVNRRATQAMNDYLASGGNDLEMLTTSPILTKGMREGIEPYLQQQGITLDQFRDSMRANALKDQNRQAADFAKEHPALATAESFVTNQIGGLQGAVNGAYNYLQGIPLNASQQVNEYSQLTPTIRGTVREGIKENANGKISGAIGAGAYDVGTSIGDMLFSLALGGGNQAASLGIMATNAGANALNDQMDKDTAPWQKVATAAASGAIEAITEKLPLENLFRLANNPAGRQTAKQIMVNVLKQAGTEAGEEAISEIANSFVDSLVNGSQSDYAQSIQAYMAQGMTEDQARLKAETDIAKNAAYSALIGGISGGVMGGGASVIGNVRNNAEVAGLRMDPMSNERAQAANRIPGLRQNAEQNTPGIDLSGRSSVDFEASQNAQLANLLQRARQQQEIENNRAQRLSEEQNAQGTMESLNNQLAQARAAFQEAQRQTSVPGLRQQNVQQEQFMQAPQTNANDPFGMLMEIMQQNQAPQEQVTQTPRDVKKDNADIKRLTDQRNLFMERYDQTQDPVAKSIADAIQLQIDNQQSRIDQAMQTEKVIGEGLDNFNAEMKDVVNRFGTDNTKALYRQLNQTLNDYVKTKNYEFIEKAHDILGKMDESMNGMQYAYNRGGTITYDPETIWNVYGTYVNDLIRANANNKTTTASTTASTTEAPKRNQVMAEDIGLNPRTNETIVDEGDKITLTADLYADEPNSTQTSRNSMYRYFDDMPDVQKLIEAQRKEGKFDKEVHTNKDTLEKAERALNENEEAVKQNLLTKEFVDEVDTAESLMLARRLFSQGDMESGSRFLQNLSYKASTPGRVLQLLGAMAGTGEGAITKANSLIREESEAYFNRPGNKSKKERCGKLATALKNIGNDHTNDPAEKAPKTYAQIKQGVVNELEKESTSVFNGFSDTDIDYLARMVERGVTTEEIQYKLEERLATGSWDISNEDLQFVLDKFNEANKHDVNSKAAAELQMEAYQRLAEYLPDSSFMEKWNNWRYLAMLGNPRTHIRNLVGNFMFGNIVSSVSDEIGGALEATANNTAKFFGGKGFERTKTAALKDNNLVKASQKYGEDHAWAQLADVKNKYSDMKRDIASEKRIFKNRVLEGYRKASGNLLTKSDEFSLMNKYKRAMAGYLQANGKDASIFNSTNTADQAMIERASDYAVRRAKEATFHEDNKIADILTNWSNTAKSKGGVAGNLLYGLEEALVPFKKTPANILKQALEYSPASVMNMVYDAVNKNPAMFIENLSKAVTGSGIMVLGAILASKGLLRAKGDEKEADLDKLTGEQDFSLNIGNDSYTLDWAAPAALPLFVGARLYENYENGNGLNPLDALASVGDPLVEMSMLQGISNTIQSVASYDKEKNGLAELGMNIGYNYLGQAVPTVAGQIARSVDDTRRTTYTGKTGIADTVGKLINKTKNKIPGLSQKSQPYVDAWGETQKNAGGNLAGRLFNNMIAPWYYSNTEKTDTEKELYRLNQEANANIVPKTAETSYDGKKLNQEEYTEYATIKGQDAQRILGETIDNPKYAGLDDTAKAELLSDMLLFSNALAKNEMFGYDISGSNTYKKKYEAYERGGVDGLIDYITLKESLNGQTSDSATIAALEAQEGLTDADKVFYFKQGKKEYSKEAQYLEGINEKYAYDWYKIQTENGKKKDDMIYGIYTSDLPEEEKNAMLEVLEMDPDELIYNLTVGK